MPLQFDAKNQLTQISGFDSYQYDASGRRVEKTPASGNSGKVFYLYNHAGQLMYQYEPGLSQATNFIHLGTQLIADNAYLLLAMPGAVSFDANPNNGSYTVSWGAVAQATSYTERAVGVRAVGVRSSIVASGGVGSAEWLDPFPRFSGFAT